MTVADALTDSRHAHLLARAAQATGQLAAAQWQTALDRRLDAARLDPDHTDPAWLEDALHAQMPGERTRRYHRVPGQTPAQVARTQHAALVAYFRVRLAPPTPAPAPLTEAAIAARVVAPQDWRVVQGPTAGAPPCQPHVWRDGAADTRTCTACGQRQTLTATMAVEETAAFTQLQQEQGRR